MNTVCRTHFLAGTLCVLTALLAGCSAGSGNGFGDAGKQSSTDPQAVITPVGHVPAADGTLFVRSGAEVVLSSKDSNGVDSAILGATWSAVNTAAQAVKILERGASAMSFRAPEPTGTDPLELRFRLTVRTADGDEGDKEIRVLVDRVPDPNDFLLSDASTTADAVNLVLVASSYTSAANFTTLGRDAEFTISVQKQVRYKRALNVGANPSTGAAPTDPLYCASTDPVFTCVKIGAPLQIAGQWKQASGVSGTSGSLFGISFPLARNGALAAPYQNPRFRLRPPSLNADEVNFAVLTNGIPTNLNATGVPPSDARRNNLLYTADIDTAEAEYVITMNSADLAGTGRRANLLVFGADPTSLNFIAEGLAATNADPGVVTITGTQALNGIKAATGVVESRSTALAYYAAIDPNNQRTNLDDWLKDNCLQRSLAGRPGHYGADLHSTYLNDRDLGFGREMYFKTDCTTAQRGATGATINTNAGERASIVFNYSSLEGAIKRSNSFLAVAMEYRADAGGGPKYTRFYTFAPDPRTREWKRVTSANFDGRRERYTPGNCTVCHGGKAKADYASGGDLGGTFIPWDANALLFADTDASILDSRILPGFTRAEQLPFIQALNVQGVRPIVTSRIAETAASGEVLTRWNATLDLLDKWYTDPLGYNYVPTTWQGGTSAGTPTLTSNTIYSQVIAENCRMCHMQRITDGSAGGQVQSTAPQFSAFADSYVSGINTTKLQQRVFEQHVMPGSRLTADRFWIKQAGATQSGAQVLAAHLGLTLAAATPKVAAVANQPSEVDPGASGVQVRLSGLQSRFASTYAWTLQRPAGSAAQLVGANTAEPAFLADVSGNYIANLTVTDASGATSTLATPVTIVADRQPAGTNYSITPNPASGAAVSVDLFATAGARPGDGANSVTILSQPPGSGAANVSNCVATCVVNFTAAGSGAIQYRITDADGDTATGQLNVTVNIPGGWNVNPGNTANPNTYDFSCNNPCSNAGLAINATALAQNALNLTPTQFSAQGYSATATITTAPSARGRNTAGTLNAGALGSAVAGSTSFTYTAPTLFVSPQGGVPVVDTFQFRITVNQTGNANNPVSTSQTGTVRMTMNPRSVLVGLSFVQATWGNVFPMLQTNCAGCHGIARSPTAPASGGEGRAWGSLSTDTTGVTTYDDLAGSRRTQCPAAESSSRPYCVEFDSQLNATIDVSGSQMLHKPLGENSHGGGSAVLLDAQQINLIRSWLLDGAYRN